MQALEQKSTAEQETPWIINSLSTAEKDRRDYKRTGRVQHIEVVPKMSVCFCMWSSAKYIMYKSTKQPLGNT